MASVTFEIATSLKACGVMLIPLFKERALGFQAPIPVDLAFLAHITHDGSERITPLRVAEELGPVLTGAGLGDWVESHWRITAAHGAQNRIRVTISDLDAHKKKAPLNLSLGGAQF